MAKSWIGACNMESNMARKKRQRTIIVLGMHRSGTSMLAGSLQEAGLALGEVVTEAPHNAKGNRENRAIMFMQEDLLKSNGGSWDNPPAAVRWRQLHEAVRDLFIGSFKNVAIWGFKDPRTLLTIDGWLQVLPNAELVGIFRSPEHVALSLHRRDGMTVEKGLDLWRIYNERLLHLHDHESFPLMEFEANACQLTHRLTDLVARLDLPIRDYQPRFFDDSLRTKETQQIPVPPRVEQLYHSLRERVRRGR